MKGGAEEKTKPWAPGPRSVLERESQVLGEEWAYRIGAKEEVAERVPLKASTVPAQRRLQSETGWEPWALCAPSWESESRMTGFGLQTPSLEPNRPGHTRKKTETWIQFATLSLFWCPHPVSWKGEREGLCVYTEAIPCLEGLSISREPIQSFPQLTLARITACHCVWH